MLRPALTRLLFLAGPLLLAPPRAHAELIIDDFSDPAMIQLPDGPDRVTTEGVGDLNATRLLKFRPVGPGFRTAQADIGVTVPGEYTVNVADAGDILFVDAEYSFDSTDWTESGRNSAVFVDFTFERGTVTELSGYLLQPPSVRLLAYPRTTGLLLADFSNALTAPFPAHSSPYTLAAPFETFTNRGGGPLEADFTDIVGFELWLSGGANFGPWEIRIDSIRVGNTSAIPEPAGLSLAISVLFCVFVARVARRFSFWSDLTKGKS